MPSSNNRERGRQFEKLAGEYLKNKGFQILENNWQGGHKEIDIIVKKENQIIFVEVKSSSSQKFGHPAERVNQKKIINLSKAAKQYILENNLSNIDMRFDLITFVNGKLEHYENAFDVVE